MEKFQKLSRAEMKNVRGGVFAPPPGGCATGQTSFNCSFSGGCGDNSGAVCATNASAAAATLTRTLQQQGVYGECYNVIACGY